MKKWLKISLVTVAILIAITLVAGYFIYDMIMGAEDLTGKLEVIPEKKVELPEITFGEDDWANWRGKNFDGKSLTKGIKTDWTNNLKEVWSVSYLCQDDATSTWASPVIQGNRLVVPGRDENDDLIFCINSQNGELLWTSSYPAEAGTSHGPGSRATPFIDNNKVYCFGRSGIISCWNLYDGELIWKKSVMDEGGAEPQWGHSTSPFVYDDKVIVQGGGASTIIAYNKENGEIIWKALEGEAGYSGAQTIDFDGETKLLIYHGTGLSCLNPADGKVLWTAPWETKYYVNATTPIVSGNIIFHTSAYGMGGEAIKARKDGYDILWTTKEFAAQHSDPILIDGYLYGYAGDSDNKGPFSCIELSSGKIMWTTKDIGGGTASFVDGYIICLDLKGNLYLLEPSPKEFKKIAEIKEAIKDVKSLAWTSPVIANGKLYLRYLQHLICYDLL